MENKINIAELLKDCPKGMELDCTICNGVKFIELDRNPNFPIVVRANNGYEFTLTKYGQVHNIDDAKCVIFPKGKTTWEGFQRPFEDGDILVHTQNQRLITSIYHNRVTELIIGTHCILWDKNDGLTVNAQICCYPDDTRLATEEEKAKLFQAIKDNGYKWNAETKTLDRLVKPKFKVRDVIQDKDGYKVRITDVSIEDECYGYESLILNGIGGVSFNRQDDWELVSNKFDITTLKPFESRVLARSDDKDRWKPAIFGGCARNRYNEIEYFYALGGTCWRNCIPYEGNEHLLGKTDDCDEFYKNW